MPASCAVARSRISDASWPRFGARVGLSVASGGLKVIAQVRRTLPAQPLVELIVTLDERTLRQTHAHGRRVVVVRVACSGELVNDRFDDKLVTFFVEVGEPLDGQIDRDIC